VKGDQDGEERMAHSFHKSAIGQRFIRKRPVDWLGSRLATGRARENEIGRRGVCGRELKVYPLALFDLVVLQKGFGL